MYTCTVQMLCRNHSGSINQSSLLNVIFSLGPSLYVSLLYFGWFLSSTVPMFNRLLSSGTMVPTVQKAITWVQSITPTLFSVAALSFFFASLPSPFFSLSFPSGSQNGYKMDGEGEPNHLPLYQSSTFEFTQTGFPTTKGFFAFSFLPIPVYWSSRPQPLLKAHLTRRSRRSTWENLSC